VTSDFRQELDFHVKRALGISLEENSTIIAETVGHPSRNKAKKWRVRRGALRRLHRGQSRPRAGVRWRRREIGWRGMCFCLCDTNGGTITGRLTEIFADVRKQFGWRARHPSAQRFRRGGSQRPGLRWRPAPRMQGCMNGYGERCGNANLASIIANPLKLGHTNDRSGEATSSPSVARFIAELANFALTRARSACRTQQPSRIRAAYTRARYRRIRRPTSTHPWKQ